MILKMRMNYNVLDHTAAGFNSDKQVTTDSIGIVKGDNTISNYIMIIKLLSVTLILVISVFGDQGSEGT